MSDNCPIGVFDSGLGGLTVVKELIKTLPSEDIVYFGDTGRVPYGSRSRDTIRKYAIEDERFLLSKNVKLIIAACGTVSSVAFDTADNLTVPFFEMVSHSAKAAVNTTKNKIIGVIGTHATINSASHKTKILELMPEAKVVTAACPLFVPLVEEGWFSPDDLVVKETVKRYLEPIINSNADTLILGCTHYPVLIDAIRNVMGENVTLINPANAVSAAVAEYLKNNNLNSNVGGDTKFFVSDKPNSFRKTASILLGNEIDEKTVEQVDLNNL